MAKKDNDGANTANPEAVERWVTEIEKHFDTLASLQGAYMKECADVRQLIKKAKKAAKGENVNVAALNGVLELRKKMRSIEKAREELEAEDILDEVDMMLEALGGFEDTPLGGAAVDRAKAKQDRKNKALASLNN